MNKRVVLELAIRIIGLWLISNIVIYMPGMISLFVLTPPEFISETNRELTKLLSVFYAIGSTTFALFLFYHASKIASKFYPEKEDVASVSVTKDKKDLFKYSLKIMGAYLTVINITSILQALPTILRAGTIFDFLILYLLPPLIGFALGIYLLISGEVFVKLAYRDNKAAIAKPQD
jgi:hypothetical protein